MDTTVFPHPSRPKWPMVAFLDGPIRWGKKSLNSRILGTNLLNSRIIWSVCLSVLLYNWFVYIYLLWHVWECEIFFCARISRNSARKITKSRFNGIDLGENIANSRVIEKFSDEKWRILENRNTSSRGMTLMTANEICGKSLTVTPRSMLFLRSALWSFFAPGRKKYLCFRRAGRVRFFFCSPGRMMI